MEELIKKIEALVKKQGGLTIDDIADLETEVIEELIKVESVSELIREQKIVDPVAEKAEEIDNSGNTKTEEIVGQIKEGKTDAAIKKAFTKNEFVAAATELKVIEKVEKNTEQGILNVLKAAVL